MPIEHCRAASRRKAPRPEQGHGPPTVKNRWRQALALGAVAALTGAQARLTPSPSAAPHPAAGGLPPKTGPYGYAQALVTPNHAPYFGTQAPAPAPTPAAPTPAPAPAWATPLAPDVIMQSFFAGLSRGMAQSGAHNAYYVSRSGFAGATFGLLFTDAPVACGATPLPTPSIPNLQQLRKSRRQHCRRRRRQCRSKHFPGVERRFHQCPPGHQRRVGQRALHRRRRDFPSPSITVPRYATRSRVTRLRAAQAVSPRCYRRR